MAVRRLNTVRPAHRPVLHTSGPIGGGGSFSPDSPSQPPLYNGNIGNLYEDVGDGPTEISTAGFMLEGTKTRRAWQITPASPSDLTNSLTDVLGAVDYNPSGTGKLTRTLPLADPFFPWAFASAIPALEGYGRATQVQADPALEAPPFPSVAYWDRYRIAVESMSRPFPVSPDSRINSISDGKWFPETGGGTTPVTFTYATEQMRYCTWDMQPEADYVTQQKGQMVFSSSDVFNNASLNAMPRGWLQTQRLVVTWYQVPLRLVTSANSFLVRFLGRVNQNPVVLPYGLTCSPGQMLYLNFGIKPYTPPVQNVVALGTGYNVVSTEKFVNIEMHFLYTNRSNISPPASAPTNKNFVYQGGHNCLVGPDFQPRYAITTSNPPVYVPPYPNQPAWLSGPLEVLWTDPDSTGITKP